VRWTPTPSNHQLFHRSALGWPGKGRILSRFTVRILTAEVIHIGRRLVTLVGSSTSLTVISLTAITLAASPRVTHIP